MTHERLEALVIQASEAFNAFGPLPFVYFFDKAGNDRLFTGETATLYHQTIFKERLKAGYYDDFESVFMILPQGEDVLIIGGDRHKVELVEVPLPGEIDFNVIVQNKLVREFAEYGFEDFEEALTVPVDPKALWETSEFAQIRPNMPRF